MLLEALEYIATPAPKWARKMGYLHEAIALRHRARRCRTVWAEHQANTKAAILKHLPDEASTITILGAGLCLDIPLLDLSARCEKLVLVDAVRLRGLRLPSNVRYDVEDVDGTAHRLITGSDQQPNWVSHEGPVVSVNLLSQLPLLPRRWIAGQGQASDLTALETTILRRHVDRLSQHRETALLIGDAKHILRNAEGGILQETDFSQRAGLPSPLSTWSWHIVPPGEASDGHTVESQVGVWSL